MGIFNCALTIRLKALIGRGNALQTYCKFIKDLGTSKVAMKQRLLLVF